MAARDQFPIRAGVWIVPPRRGRCPHRPASLRVQGSPPAAVGVGRHAHMPPQAVEKPRRRLLEQSSGECVQGVKTPCAFNQSVFSNFLKFENTPSVAKKTFSPRWGGMPTCRRNQVHRPPALHKSYPATDAPCAPLRWERSAEVLMMSIPSGPMWASAPTAQFPCNRGGLEPLCVLLGPLNKTARFDLCT